MRRFSLFLLLVCLLPLLLSIFPLAGKPTSRSNEEKLKDYYLRARSQINRGDYEAAIRYLASCARIDPDSALVNREMARAYLAMGKRLTAQQYIEKARKQAPKDKEIKQLAARIKEEKDAKPKTAPKLPKKSLLIYDDHFFFGVKEELGSHRSESRNDYHQRRYGISSRRYQVDTERSFMDHIFFARSWVRDNIKHPGDLRSYLKKGALTFYLRTERQGLNLEVGFQEEENVAKKKRHYFSSESGPPVISQPLRSYIYADDMWQKVIIPLAEFKPEGYYLTRNDDAGDELPYPIRRPIAFYWKDTAAFIHGYEASGDEFTYWLDEIAVVPSYNQAEYQAAIITAAQRRKQEILSEVILFADSPPSPFWVHGDAYSQVVIDETVRKNGKTSAHFIMSPSGKNKGARRAAEKSTSAAMEASIAEQEANIEIGDSSPEIEPLASASAVDAEDLEAACLAGISLPETDLSNFYPDGALEFYVRGENGGEHFKITLYSRYRMAEEALIMLPGITAYTTLNQHWQKMSIPFTEFMLRRDFDWSRIIRIEFGSSPEPGTQISFYIDDLKFVRRPTIKGNVQK